MKVRVNVNSVHLAPLYRGQTNCPRRNVDFLSKFASLPGPLVEEAKNHGVDAAGSGITDFDHAFDLLG